MKIGVFDSGIGGRSVAEALQRLIPSAEITSVDDRNNVPYGNKSNQEIIKLTLSAVKPLIEMKCDAIVIACNTATTVAIDSLRSKYPDTNIIGLEPMVKPASTLTKSGSIIVLATPATLKSDRYNKLKEEWAADIKISEPDCSDWAALIEAGKMDEIDIRQALSALDSDNADVVVLACTHYHWLKDRILDAIKGKKVVVMEPSDAIASRIHQLIG